MGSVSPRDDSDENSMRLTMIMFVVLWERVCVWFWRECEGRDGERESEMYHDREEEGGSIVLCFCPTRKKKRLTVVRSGQMNSDFDIFGRYFSASNYPNI